MYCARTAQFLFETRALEENIKLEGTIESLLDSIECTARVNFIIQLKSKGRIRGNNIWNVVRFENIGSMLDDILQYELWQRLARE